MKDLVEQQGLSTPRLSSSTSALLGASRCPFLWMVLVIDLLREEVARSECGGRSTVGRTAAGGAIEPRRAVALQAQDAEEYLRRNRPLHESKRRIGQRGVATRAAIMYSAVVNRHGALVGSFTLVRGGAQLPALYDVVPVFAHSM